MLCSRIYSRDAGGAEARPPVLARGGGTVPPGPRLRALGGPLFSEGGTIRLETLIELKFLNSSFLNSNSAFSQTPVLPHVVGQVRYY